MKTIKELFFEKLYLNADINKNDEKNITSFNTSEEVANFIHDSISGSKMKKVLDHGYSSASFKNWGDHSAYAYAQEVYEIIMPDNKHVIRVGICHSTNKINSRKQTETSISGINKGDIIFTTAVKSKTMSGKYSMSWNSDCLTGYEPGTDFLKFIKIAYTGRILKSLFKEYKIIDDE